MATELRRLLLARIQEAEVERRHVQTRLKYLTAEIRDMKNLLIKRDRALRTLPKAQFTKVKSVGRRKKASGESVSSAEPIST